MKSLISNFREICPAGTALIHVYIQTDAMKLVGASHIYANTPKN